MSKIVKKKDLDVLIESTMSKAGLVKEDGNKSFPYGAAANYFLDKVQMLKYSIEETNKKLNESKSTEKPLISENVQKELNRFNRLSNYTFKK